MGQTLLLPRDCEKCFPPPGTVDTRGVQRLHILSDPPIKFLYFGESFLHFCKTTVITKIPKRCRHPRRAPGVPQTVRERQIACHLLCLRTSIVVRDLTLATEQMAVLKNTSSYDTTLESELIARVLQGEKEVFYELIRAHEKSVVFDGIFRATK